MAVMRALLVAALAAFALQGAAAQSCPSISAGEVPGSCLSKDAGTVCSSCVDDVFALFAGKVGGSAPCDFNVGSCVGGAASAFVAAKANVAALRGCDAGSAAQRIQPRISCVGTKPTVDQVANQLRSFAG